MPYVPHTPEDVREMLATIGVGSIDELFREIPDNLRRSPGDLDLPAAQDEATIAKTLGGLAGRNRTDLVSFLGAGVYDRFIPAAVGAVISRGEFLTSYTPYQPELSQGYLQTIYEFQSMIAELFGMDLANASMYDGSTALAEAALMAVGVKGKDRVVASAAIHPHHLEVLRTYCWGVDVEVVIAPLEDGRTVWPTGVDASAFLVQSPNFYGLIEDLAAARSACDGLLVVGTDPVACALLRSPGSYGADIVVGEGQSLGVAQGFGGPYVGLFATKQELVRNIPGRIVGKTTEAHGDREGYVMTLRTREQDIRREKATSNICTNEALMALANTVHLAAIGKSGLLKVAEGSVRNARYAESRLAERGVPRVHGGRYFAEFTVRTNRPAAEIRDAGLEKGILAGLPLSEVGGPPNELLLAFTELRTPEEIDALVDLLA